MSLFIGVQYELCAFLSTFCGVFEGEACFGLSQLVEVVEAHYIGCLKMALRVLVTFPASPYLVVKLGGGQWSQEGRVGAGNAYAII